jgi:hypothetical protein
MATHSDATTVASNASDANFRTWINFIHDMMIAAGWNQTSDTGQINFVTASAPTVGNEKIGYALYEMTDALAATAPVIVKFAFGSAALANRPGVWFRIGTHSDGAGNLIDPNDENRPGYLFDMYSQTAPALAHTASNTNAWLSVGSGTGGQVVFVLFEGVASIKDAFSGTGVLVQTNLNDWQSSVGTLLFSIERGRNWNGDPVGTHLSLLWSSAPGTIDRHMYVEAQHGHTLLPPIAGLIHGLGNGAATATSPTAVSQGHSGCPLTGGQAYEVESLAVVAPASPPIHFLRNTFPVPPGVNVQLSRWSRFVFPFVPDWQNPPDPVAAPVDNVPGTTIAISPYAVSRTYRTVAGLRASNHTGSAGLPTVWVYILFE